MVDFILMTTIVKQLPTYVFTYLEYKQKTYFQKNMENHILPEKHELFVTNTLVI